MDSNHNIKDNRLSPYFSRAGVWAFSIGTSIGWGSFVVTCNTYLFQAGILGTVFGLAVGMAVILIINHNLCYMLERAPSAGGIYAWGGQVRGHDIGFLIAWFLLLTYLAVLWANITSLPLFAQRFFGRMFQFGFSYVVFGYRVYLGEALLSMAAVSLVGLLCARSKRIPQLIMIVLAFFFVGGLIVTTAAACIRHGGSGFSYEPGYLPDRSALGQIVRIAVISPWAFIGFENVAHFSEEYAFPLKKIRGVMLASVVMTTLVYVLMSILSVSAYPAEYDSWFAYIRDMDNLEGIKAIPAFYAAEHYMGPAGITVMILSLLAVILTSIIGNLTAISRLLFSFGREHEWVGRLGKLNKYGIPGHAILVTVLVSCVIPFLGRTAIGWIVDVTTLGAAIIYGLLSDSVWLHASEHGDRTAKWTGAAGTALMIGVLVLLLAPKLIAYEAMEPESYLLFALWSLLGLIAFRAVLVRDKQARYGHSLVVWVVLLLLMLLTSMMWTSRDTQLITEDSIQSIQNYYTERVEQGSVQVDEAEAFVSEQEDRIESANIRTTMTSFVMFIVAVVILGNNYNAANSKAKEWKEKFGTAHETGLTDALTGIKNKRAFSQWEERIDGQINSGDCPPFAIVVCDINNLKTINDMQGHIAGDECIRRACAAICKIFSHSPVFRYGGDEFVVILRGEDFENRRKLLSLVDEQAQANLSRDGDAIAAGMAEYVPDEHNSMLRVFEQADRRMYERKKQLKQQQAALAAQAGT